MFFGIYNNDLNNSFKLQMNILALDVGTKKTGAALSSDGTTIALDTITHDSVDELVGKILELISERQIDKIVLGLPYLLSGIEGEQAEFVRSVEEKLVSNNIDVILLDERYTTPKSTENDQNKAAACSILAIYEDKQKS